MDSPSKVALSKIELQNRDARFAMRLSLIVGVLMLVGKVAAFLVYGVFCHLFRCSGIGSACGRCRVRCVQSLAERTTGGSAISLWIRANHLFLRRF